MKLTYLLLLLCGGCSVVSNNRVFPKLTWYWSADAKQQREDRKQLNQIDKDWQKTLGQAVTNRMNQ